MEFVSIYSIFCGGPPFPNPFSPENPVQNPHLITTVPRLLSVRQTNGFTSPVSVKIHKISADPHFDQSP
jgi:hypothetical protein